MWNFLEKENRNQPEKDQQNSKLKCDFTVGKLCPRCKKGQLEYNGLLNLVCPICGNELSANFT